MYVYLTFSLILFPPDLGILLQVEGHSFSLLDNTAFIDKYLTMYASI